jgi:hypothetical protein
VTRANAPLTELGRLRLARCVVDDHWPLRPAADRFQVSVGTAQRWADRYRELGAAGMADRSSRPLSSPRRTQTRAERRIIKVRLARRRATNSPKTPNTMGYAAGMSHAAILERALQQERCKLSQVDEMEVASPAWP